MVTHSKERAHACVQCNKSFSKAQHMKTYTHKQILTHSKETPHKCTQCDYACWEAGNLRRHMKTHSLQKSNQCKWCEYSSITKSDLSRLLLTHSGERSHYCKECGRTFAKAGNLKTTSAFTLEKKFSSAKLANLKQQQNVRHLVFALQKSDDHIGQYWL